MSDDFERALATGQVDAAEAVAATVAGARFVLSHGDAACLAGEIRKGGQSAARSGSGSGAAAAVIDVSAALIRAIFVERSLGESGWAANGEDRRASNMTPGRESAGFTPGLPRGSAALISDRANSSTSLLDLPERLRYCPATEPFVIPADDPRVSLRGQLGARAKRQIPAGTLLGPYACYMCERKGTPECYNKRMLRGGMHGEMSHERFAHSFLSETKDGGEYMADAFRFGNLSAAVNDVSEAPMEDKLVSPSSANGCQSSQQRALNVEMIEVSVHGFPFMFHATVADVECGEELLTSYGESYWDGIREKERRLIGIFDGNMEGYRPGGEVALVNEKEKEKEKEKVETEIETTVEIDAAAAAEMGRGPVETSATAAAAATAHWTTATSSAWHSQSAATVAVNPST